MKIALTQMDIVWENKKENQKKCEHLVRQASEQGADIIVFPEMTLTGFTMNTGEMGENEISGGATVEFFSRLSGRYRIGIIFGMIYLDGGKTAYNKALFVDGTDILINYSKIHPFSYGGETEYYSGGSSVAGAEYRGIRLGCFVCYDLRFPEIFQISSVKNQIIVVIANWPAERVEHWNTLLKARAIENQSYIIGVNRTGEGNGLSYICSSVAYDPYGIRMTENTSEELIFGEIEPSMVEKYRKDFPVKEDRREALYREYM